MNNYGLADVEGSVEINYAPNCADLTSIFRTKQVTEAGIQTQIVEAQVETGDRYLLKTGLQKVDFLKIDVEGAEPLVFDGFREAFADGRVECIQFEFGHSTLSLRDHFTLFENYGYKVGKIFFSGCEFEPYDPVREFVVANYIAVRSDRTDIISALSCARCSGTGKPWR